MRQWERGMSAPASLVLVQSRRPEGWARISGGPIQKPSNNKAITITRFRLSLLLVKLVGRVFLQDFTLTSR